MPLPLAALAGPALTYGGAALAAWALLRATTPARRDQRAEDALDAVDEGLALRFEPGQAGATARVRRIIRLGATGPGIEIDAALLGRVRFRKVTA